MTDTLRPPSLRVQVPRDDQSSAWSSSSTPTLRRRRMKMRRMKKMPSERMENGSLRHSGSLLAPKDYLQLPAIEITPSSDEDAPWSNCSTPSASPRRKRFLIRKWLKVREKKETGNESSSQPSSQQSSHDDDSSRFLTPFMRRVLTLMVGILRRDARRA